MKKLLLALLVGGSFGLMKAQEMPQPSPAATTIQRVGLTDVEIVYSRPSVKEREIFGGLVPYNEIWRTGANASTKVKFSTEVTIDGNKLAAGTYSFYAIPSAAEWIIIFNKNLDHWGTDGYDEADDAVRVTVRPVALAVSVESMRISVENLTKSSGEITLSWDKTSVAVPFSVEVDAQIEKNIQKSMSDAHRAFRAAANLAADNGEYEKAIEYIDMAANINPESWYTQWLKAEILQKSGDTKKALKQGEAAIAMGDAYYEKAGRPFSYKAGLEKSMAEWKEKK